MKILRLNDEVEEEVVINVNEMELVCFSNMLPYGAKEGMCYRIELIPMVFNDYLVHELNSNTFPSITRIKNSFSYVIVGKLIGNRLDAGPVILEDDLLLSSFGYLDGKIIS